MILEDTHRVVEENGNYQYQPATNTITYNNDLPIRHNSTIVEQMSW